MFFKDFLDESSAYGVLSLVIIPLLALISVTLFAANFNQTYDSDRVEVGISEVKNNYLYIDSGKELIISSVSVGAVDCGFSGVYHNLTVFDIESCVNKNSEANLEVKVVSNLGEFTEELLVEKNIYQSYNFE